MSEHYLNSSYINHLLRNPNVGGKAQSPVIPITPFNYEKSITTTNYSKSTEPSPATKTDPMMSISRPLNLPIIPFFQKQSFTQVPFKTSYQNDPEKLEYYDKNKNRYALALMNMNIDETVVDQILLPKMEKRREELQDLNSRSQGIVRSFALGKFDDELVNQEFEYISPVYTKEQEASIRDTLTPVIRGPEVLTKVRDDIVVNNLHITHDDLITDYEYEMDESNKIMRWIENNLIFAPRTQNMDNIFMFFSDLITFHHKGHIYIIRAGLPPNTGLNPSLINLKFFKYMYGKPINLNGLASELSVSKFANTVMAESITDQRLIEANKIIGLENFICLQPEPKYLMFILKRLIYAWYADEFLIRYVLKIRVLVNHYRARRDKEDNVNLGVLPMILIYMRYGETSFNHVLSKVNYYFTNYLHLGWKGNHPDYFSKYNDLIYYANGSPNIKRFFENLSPEAKKAIYNQKVVNPEAAMRHGSNVVQLYPQSNQNYDSLEYVDRFSYIKN